MLLLFFEEAKIDYFSRKLKSIEII